MSDRAQRKARQRLKRKQKRRELHRAANASPYRRAAGGELVGCWINHDWRERGQATVWVLRRGAGGVLSFATFLVDSWCAGLKDAWGRTEIFQDEFDDAIERMSEQLGGTIAPCDLEEARYVIAGAVRFAVENGFRLAGRYDRWTAFLGSGPIRWREAELDGFGVEGDVRRLRWVGPLEDLRTRLIGSTVEQFIDRPDVEAIFDGQGTHYEEFEEDELDEDEGMDQFEQLSEQAADAARLWCAEKGLAPEPMLVEAMAFSFAAILMSAPNPSQPPTREAYQNMMNEMLREAPVDDRNDLIAACAQAQQFVASFASPLEFVTSFKGESPPS